MGDISSPVLAARPAPQMPKPANDKVATAREFEAVFIGQITKMMMETVDAGDEFSGGHGEEMFRGVLAEQMGNEIARRGGIGLAPAVLAQMIRMQEGAANAR